MLDLEDLRTFVEVADAGLGIAQLPDFLIDRYVSSGALVPVMTRFPLAEGGILVRRYAQKSLRLN